MGFSAMTQQDNFSSDADRWLSEQIDKIIAENPLKFLRESRPWIYDIIRVLIVPIRCDFQLPTNPSAYGGGLLPGANRV
jgi:hypothetical protein